LTRPQGWEERIYPTTETDWNMTSTLKFICEKGKSLWILFPGNRHTF
jgi:hypothetical protein